MQLLSINPPPPGTRYFKLVKSSIFLARANSINIARGMSQNMNYSKTKLTMPVLALGGGYNPALGGNLTVPIIAYSMKQAAQNV
jgi:hypothetical protein